MLVSRRCAPGWGCRCRILSRRGTREPGTDAFRHVAEAFGDDSQPAVVRPRLRADDGVGRPDRPAEHERRRHADRRERDRRAPTARPALLKGDPLKGATRFYSGVGREWWAPLRPGMRVRRRNALVGVLDKRSAFAEPIGARVDGRGVPPAAHEPLLSAQHRLMIRTERTSRPRPTQGSTPRGRDRARTPTSRSIASTSRVRRRAVPAARRRAGWWEDVTVGDEIGPLVKGPMRVTDMVVLAHGHGHGPVRREGVAPRVPTAAARARLLPPRRAQRPRRAPAGALGPGVGAAGRQPGDRTTTDGCASPGSCTSAPTGWATTRGWRRSTCEFRKFNYVGDTQWMRGKVTRQLPRRGRPAGHRPRHLGPEPARRDHLPRPRDDPVAEPRARQRAPPRSAGRGEQLPGRARCFGPALRLADAGAGGLMPLKDYPGPVEELVVALDDGVLRVRLDARPAVARSPTRSCSRSAR